MAKPRPSSKKKTAASAKASAAPAKALSTTSPMLGEPQPRDQDASGWTADQVLARINLDFANDRRSLFFGDNGTLYYRQC